MKHLRPLYSHITITILLSDILGGDLVVLLLQGSTNKYAKKELSCIIQNKLNQFHRKKTIGIFICEKGHTGALNYERERR